MLVEEAAGGSALDQQRPEQTRNKVIHTTVSDTISRRGGNARITSQYQTKNQQMHINSNDQ